MKIQSLSTHSLMPMLGEVSAQRKVPVRVCLGGWMGYTLDFLLLYQASCPVCEQESRLICF